MTRFNTLLLDTKTWDLLVDSSGNIAMAEPPYSLAQDVGSAIKLFLGELFYQTDKGIPYFSEILGQMPPLALITARLEQAAKSVPGVVQVQVIIDSFTDRIVTGRVNFIDEQGQANGIKF